MHMVVMFACTWGASWGGAATSGTQAKVSCVQVIGWVSLPHPLPTAGHVDVDSACGVTGIAGSLPVEAVILRQMARSHHSCGWGPSLLARPVTLLPHAACHMLHAACHTQDAEEWCGLLPYCRGPLLVLVLLAEGSWAQLSGDVLCALGEALSAGSAPLAAQLSAELPSYNLWHEPGHRCGKRTGE